MTEKDVANEMFNAHPFVFRNDNGCGYVGGRVLRIRESGMMPIEKGQLVVVNPSKITYGLYPGSGDYVGWTPIEITPDMVGKRIAVFTSVEIKTKNDNMSNRQINWFKRVKEAGGIAEIWKEQHDGSIRRIVEL